MEYSKLASGQVSSLGGATPVTVPFDANFIEIFNPTRATAVSGVTRAWCVFPDMASGSAMLVTTSAGPADGTSFITSGGFTLFDAFTYAYGPTLTISSMTKANPPVVTTSGNHNLVTGDVVVFTNLAASATTGMQQLCNIPWIVTVTAPTTFTIPVDASTSQFTALTSGFVKQQLYPYQFFPGVNAITAITTGTTTTITTSDNHNYVVGQEVAFRIPAPWGTTQLNPQNNFPYIPGGYSFVTAVNSATQFVVNVNSTGYTAFTFPTVAQVNAGLAPAQVVAVGDNNTGSASGLYLPPTTINGPTIGGAFQNNSQRGFIIGASIAGTEDDTIIWRAYAHDLAT